MKQNAKNNIKLFIIIIAFSIGFSFSNSTFAMDVTKIENENFYINKVAFDRANNQRMFVAADYISLDYKFKDFEVLNFSGIGGSGMLLSEDGGKTYTGTKFFENMIVLDVIQDNTDNNIWYASVVENTRGVVYKSTDNGISWDNFGLGCDGSKHHIKLVQSLDNSIFHIASVNSGLGYSSSNNNFVSCPTNNNLQVTARDLKVSQVKDGLMFIAGGSDGRSGVYRSNNNGLTWEKDVTGLRNLRIHSVMPSPRYENLVYCGADSLLENGDYVGKGYFRSKDGGISWHNFFISGMPVYDIQQHPTMPKYMLAACGKGGLYASKSYGEAWEKVELNGLQDSSIRRVFIPDWEEGAGEDGGFKAFFEVFNSGLYLTNEFIKPILVSVENDLSTMGNVNIYPNPNNGSEIRIEFTNPKDQVINYKLLDITGQIIYTNSNFELSGIINKEFSFDGVKALSNGIYILEIEMNGTIINNKVIVNK